MRRAKKRALLRVSTTLHEKWKMMKRKQSREFFVGAYLLLFTLIMMYDNQCHSEGKEPRHSRDECERRTFQVFLLLLIYILRVEKQLRVMWNNNNSSFYTHYSLVEEIWRRLNVKCRHTMNDMVSCQSRRCASERWKKCSQLIARFLIQSCAIKRYLTL